MEKKQKKLTKLFWNELVDDSPYEYNARGIENVGYKKSLDIFKGMTRVFNNFQSDLRVTLFGLGEENIKSND